MAYPITLGNICEYIIETIVNGQTCLSVFHYKYTGTASITDGGAALLSLANNLNGSGGLLPKYADCLANNVIINQASIQLIWPTRWRRIAPDITTTTGLYDGGCDNPSVAVAISKAGDIARKGGGGTLHLPGIPTTIQENGRISADYSATIDPLEVQIAAVKTGASGQTWQPIIYNRANPANSIAITSVSTETTLRTMRRRVVGRGI